MTHPPGSPTPPDFTAPFAANGPQPDNRRTLTIALAAVVVVLALVLAAGIVFVVKARKGDIYIPGLTLTAANDPGIAPFTDPVVAAGAGELPGNVALTANVGAPDMGGRAVNGTEPGLYATGDSAACDTAALSNRLMADPAAAAAWAGVFGISTASIPYYLNTLTSVVLTADTWVTNHTFASGRANPFQAILQRGTAVYVDAAGVPRAVCSCGNPLAPPAAAPIGGYRLEGQPWPGYQTRSVTRVAYADQHVTDVAGTTTLVPGAPAPAPGAPVLQVLNFLTGLLVELPAGGSLDLSGLPPLTEPLPTPASLNTPFAAETEDDAERNGLAAAHNPAAAPAVEQRSVEDGGLPVGAPESDVPASGADGTDPSAPAAGAESGAPGAEPSAPQSPAAGSVPGGSEVPGAPPASGAPPAPTPTAFSGTGDLIGSFEFRDAGASVGCTVPADGTGTVTLTCGDGVPQTVDMSALLRPAVLAATDPGGVWTLTLSGPAGAQPVAVVAASWIVPPPAVTTTTPPPAGAEEAPAPEETPAESPATSETPPTSEMPSTSEAPAPESPAAPEPPADSPPADPSN
ncbi:hypothetical protein ACN94_04820 [Gordonia paraffinivorans]|uniref:DUF6777 domain-containing protein n=1 Tax=Gordonia paraffinivorans TaxID=175628 RepID=UPI001C92DD6F|nr:DUF6777 domain-containing protein [Gordonia paraffinivorans]MBY4572924.1 hypothetical protein [Gordonia paraffinivorans]